MISSKKIISVSLVLLLLMPAMVTAMRDPTTPLEQRSNADLVPAGALNLTAILMRSGKRMAIINGKSYQQGDSIGDIRIISIESDKVVLSGNSGEFSLLMFENDRQDIVIKKH